MTKTRVRTIKIFAFLLAFTVICSLRPVDHMFGQAAKNFNVIIITLDALRPDHLGCYGYPLRTSPYIDKLAREGVMFTKAFSQTSWTGGSVVSLLTSTYPSTHQIISWGDVLDERLVTLAQVLKDQDYVTACVKGGDWIYRDVPGIGRGFDHFFEAGEVKELFKEVAEWIRENKSKKFFAWVHLFDYPHAPYRPPPPFDTMFISGRPPRDIPISKENSEFLSFGVIPSSVATDNITDINYYLSQYDGEIAFADSLIGEFLDVLKKEQVAGNTILIISADHGESLGERGMYFEHGNCIYNEVIRVPLIINGSMIPRGRVINDFVQLIDIMPSLADMLGIRLNGQIEGESFFPFKSKKNRNFAFSEVSTDRMVAGSRINMVDQSITFGDWQLIYEKVDNDGAATDELYNLKTDPQELHNVAPVEKERLKFLKQKLDEWIRRPRIAVERTTTPLDEEARKKLRSLGYLN
jgi:choline-sulfatase